jgi:LPXTG-motif cell wall-anchored protein
MAIGISGSGGSAGPAESGQVTNVSSGQLVFPGGSVSSGTGMSLLTWLVIAAVAGVGTYIVRKKRKG